MLLHETLEKTGKIYPDKIAIVSKDEEISYRNLELSAKKLAVYLIAQGVKSEDRVVIYLRNSVASIISIYGTLIAGCSFIVVNSAMKSKKLNYILADSEAKYIVADYGKKDIVLKAIKDDKIIKEIIWKLSKNDKLSFNLNGIFTGIKQNSFDEILKGLASGFYQKSIIDINIASIIYTSGSTGFPKGIICTHKSMVSVIESVTSIFNNTSEDVILNCLPISFDYGLYQILMCIYFGGTLILEKSMAYPVDILRLIEKYRVTGFPVVPTIAAKILDTKTNNFDFSKLRYISNTGSTLSVHLINRLKKTFPDTKIILMYGLTECKRVSYLPPEYLDSKTSSVGVPIPNTQVKIVNEIGENVPSGVVGELVVRGTNVMQGYLNDPKETERTFRIGKHIGERLLYTGDLFMKDEGGFLYFVSRKDDLIKTKGERVSPKEIEETIYEIEDVREVFVAGIHDDVYGQLIKAFVVPKDINKFDPKKLIKYCKENMEDSLVPSFVQLFEFFPKNENGKINKKKIIRSCMNIRNDPTCNKKQSMKP